MPPNAREDESTETENGDRDNEERETLNIENAILQNLHNLFIEQYRKQYINYQKWYYASDKYRKRGRLLSWIELGIGLLLLVLLGGLITGLVDEGIVEEGIATDLLIIVSVVSAVVIAFPIIKAKESWAIKAVRYHKYGQIHQSLFTELEFLIQTKFFDEEVTVKELEEDYEELTRRKNELNRVSPQLATGMYQEVLDNVDIDTNVDIGEFRTIAEVRSENQDNSDESVDMVDRSGRKSGRFYKFLDLLGK